MEFLEVLTEGLERVLMVRGSGREVITIYSWTEMTGIHAAALQKQISSLFLSDLNNIILKNMLVLCHCLYSHLRHMLRKSLRRDENNGRSCWTGRTKFHWNRFITQRPMIKPKTMPKDKFPWNDFLNVKKREFVRPYMHTNKRKLHRSNAIIYLNSIRLAELRRWFTFRRRNIDSSTTRISSERYFNPISCNRRLILRLKRKRELKIEATKEEKKKQEFENQNLVRG
jgi:hypothetical protein